MRCFEDIVEKTHEFLDELLRQHFGRYKELERYMSALTFRERDIHREETRVVLEKLLQLESDPLYTQNFQALQAEETRWLSTYSRASPSVRPSAYPVHRFPSKTFPHIQHGSPTTPGQNDVLKVMANVQAYFQVAHKRIIDYVPLAIEHELNQSFASAIDTTLFNAIAKDTEGGRLDLNDIVREDPAVERKRKELEHRKGRLLQIKQKLDNFRSTFVDVEFGETYDTSDTSSVRTQATAPGDYSNANY